MNIKVDLPRLIVIGMLIGFGITLLEAFISAVLLAVHYDSNPALTLRPDQIAKYHHLAVTGTMLAIPNFIIRHAFANMLLFALSVPTWVCAFQLSSHNTNLVAFARVAFVATIGAVLFQALQLLFVSNL